MFNKYPGPGSLWSLALRGRTNITQYNSLVFSANSSAPHGIMRMTPLESGELIKVCRHFIYDR